MRPTRRDLFATLLVAAIIGIYTVYVRNTTGWVVSDTRATTGLVLVLGAAACALGQTDDLFPRNHRRATAPYVLWTSVLGITALSAAVVGTVSDSAAALTVLFGATVLLWASATLRHAYAAEPADPAQRPERGPRTHEVIEPETHGVTKGPTR